MAENVKGALRSESKSEQAEEQFECLAIPKTMDVEFV